MAAYTHWRLRCWIGSGLSYVQLAEVILLSSGGTDLSVGGTASASTSFGGVYVPGAAFDKNDSTEWATVSGDPDVWIQYELGSPVDVAKISVRYSANTSYLPATVRLEAANSGSGPWVPLVLAGQRPTAATTLIYDVLPGPLTGVVHGFFGSGQLYAPTVFTPLAAQEHKVWLSGDQIHGGPGYIFGTTYLDGSPDTPVGYRRVRLHRDVDGLAIRETWSNAAGVYEFRDVNPAYKYTVIAYDHTHNYRAVAADNLTPELMA